MDKERHLPKESYKTAYITFVRGDHLWNFLCNEDRNDSECGINHECDHMHIMECSNVFCILCTHTDFIDRDSIYLARLIIAVATFYVILPMILQNLAFLLQLLFKVRSSRFAILEWVIYGRFGRTFLYPLNYQLDANVLDSNPIWKAQYVNSAIICIVVLFAAGVFSIWFAKRQFIKQDQAQNRMLTRLSEIQNKVITTIVITILCFNALSNHEIYVHIFKYDETLRTRIYRLVAWGKEFMCSSDSYKLIIQKLNAVHWLIYLVMILVITYFAVSIIQTIRRKCYERAC